MSYGKDESHALSASVVRPALTLFLDVIPFKLPLPNHQSRLGSYRLAALGRI
jgi:hypothetical protein